MFRAQNLSVTFFFFRDYNFKMQKLTVIFIFPVLFLNAQGTVWENEEVNPCGSENNTLIINKHQVPQAYNREADIM